ncbi:hypothetical protein [Bradyrhizobium sp.]|uniref:hypothetical protein n=1 Tax=Bradyrhizobium sp. TaxID=376 RepID=UPI0027338D9B|nr:hypothetical protein [Bradyrhizobium sp.]
MIGKRARCSHNLLTRHRTRASWHEAAVENRAGHSVCPGIPDINLFRYARARAEQLSRLGCRGGKNEPPEAAWETGRLSEADFWAAWQELPAAFGTKQTHRLAVLISVDSGGPENAGRLSNLAIGPEDVRLPALCCRSPHGKQAAIALKRFLSSLAVGIVGALSEKRYGFV